MKADAKLTEPQIRIVRRAYRDGASFQELADEYGVHAKTIERLVRGFDFREAGGPIAEAPGQIRSGDPYDATRWVRCSGCGALAHPPCYKCAVDADRKSAT